MLHLYLSLEVEQLTLLVQDLNLTQDYLLSLTI